MRRYIIIAITIALGVVTYTTPLFLKKERNGAEEDRLKVENRDLLARIDRMQIAYEEVTKERDELIVRGKIFSQYPFNTKNRITVSVGESEGVRLAQIATVGDNIVLGYVREVAPHTSVVETVFDPSLQLPVRIGIHEVDGMLQGGAEPKVVLIEKTKAIQVGDAIYGVANNMPYGLKIGEVGTIQDKTGNVFNEAVIRFSYSINELREVGIRVR